MNETKLPVEIKNKTLPKDTIKDYDIYYNSKKRTAGGFVDAVFLASLILTVGVWIMLLVILGGK